MSSSATTLSFNREGNSAAHAAIDTLIIAGWTGRDPIAMEAHIVELEKIGVKRPASTPIFYRTAAQLLTQAPAIEVVGGESSGEVEPVIFSLPDGLWLGIGSDHTDRKVETVGIAISKQLCAKPVGKTLWRFESVAEHWDQLIIRSYATRNSKRWLYQEGALARMRHPDDLIERYGVNSLPIGTAMFCGTLAVHGEITPSDMFDIELEDPVYNRKMSHSYRIAALPIAG
jgi:hypothetical protein